MGVNPLGGSHTTVTNPHHLKGKLYKKRKDNHRHKNHHESPLDHKFVPSFKILRIQRKKLKSISVDGQFKRVKGCRVVQLQAGRYQCAYKAVSIRKEPCLLLHREGPCFSLRLHSLVSWVKTTETQHQWQHCNETMLISNNNRNNFEALLYQSTKIKAQTLSFSGFKLFSSSIRVFIIFVLWYFRN